MRITEYLFIDSVPARMRQAPYRRYGYTGTGRPWFDRPFLLIFQELSPTSDTNLVHSLMNLIDCFMDDFADENKQKERNDQESFSLLEVRHCFFWVLQ
jgi:hypothetical protein